MNKTVKIYVERNGVDEIEVEVDVRLDYDSGEYLEANHPSNGYGAGMETSIDSVVCKEIPDIELTGDEEERAYELACEEASEDSKDYDEGGEYDDKEA